MFLEGNKKYKYILFADIVGYTALMQKDENNAANILQKFRIQVQGKTAANKGIISNFYGDGVLCFFDDLTSLLDTAVQLQTVFQISPVVPVRIGIHSGEVFISEENAYGNAVNLASRIESVGIAGSITLSNSLNTELINHPKYKTTSLGKLQFKNIQKKQEVFALVYEGLSVPKRNTLEGKFEKRKNYMMPLMLVGLVFILGFLSLQYFTSNQKRNAVIDRSLAVIPLEDLNRNPEQIYFTDGISQDILTHLSGIKDLQVISFNSSKKYRDSEKSIKEIGEELGVKHLLLGSVQQLDQRLRIRARLINAQSDHQVWAETYDREMEDVFSIQSEVAQEIADVLKTQLSPNETKRINQRPTNNLEAYKYYSKGRFEWELRTQTSLFKAVDFYEKAIELDKDFALAYAGLAQTYASLGSNGHILLHEGYAKARQYAEKALKINPFLSEAYSTLAASYIDYEFDFNKALGYYEKSLEIKPNDATTHQWLSEAYISKGQIVEARNELEIAKKLNPKSLAVQMIDAFICLGEGKNENAIQTCKSLLNQFPDNKVVEFYLVKIYLEAGQLEKGMELLKKIDPQFTKKDYWIIAYSKLKQFNNLRALKNEIAKVEDTKTRDWLLEFADFHLFLENNDFENYASKLDSFIFIKRNRNLLGEQIFRSPPEARKHPRYLQMMNERGFSIIER